MNPPGSSVARRGQTISITDARKPAFSALHGSSGTRRFWAWRFHSDNQAIITERIYLDKSDKNILHLDITSHDHALMRPWTKSRTLKRSFDNVWVSYACSADNSQVRIGKEAYFLSADGRLMPTRKGQPPPDTYYFQKR